MLRKSLMIAFCFACLPAMATFAGAADKPEAKAEKKLDELIAKAAEGKTEDRAAAIDALGALGSEAIPGVPVLIGALQGDSDELAWRGARALSSVGPGAKAAKDALLKGADHADSRVQAYSALALGALGQPTVDVVEKLTKLTTNDEALVRRAAVRALRHLQPSHDLVLEHMLKALEDADPSIAAHALHTVTASGEKAIPGLEKALDHPRSAFWACLAAAELGPKAAPLVPKLAATLASKDPEVRLQALVALAEIGDASKPAAAKIIEVLSGDKELSVKTAAAFVAGRLKLADAAKPLAELSASKEEFPKMVSVWALARIHPADSAARKDAVAALLAGLQSKEKRIRAAAVRGLIELDLEPEVIRPHLLALLNDEDPTVAANVREAIASQGEKVLPKLTAALKEKATRNHALSILKMMGEKAAEATPDLAAALSEDDAELRLDALMVLVSIGPKAKSAAGAVAALAAHESPEIRVRAIYALGKIEADPKVVLPIIEKGLTSEDVPTKLVSAWALARVAPEDPRVDKVAVPALTLALVSQKELIRKEAAIALGQLGPRAKSAVEPLRVLLGDSDSAVRSAAAAALKKIEK